MYKLYGVSEAVSASIRKCRGNDPAQLGPLELVLITGLLCNIQDGLLYGATANFIHLPRAVCSSTVNTHLFQKCMMVTGFLVFA
jgi:hypothetical protein